ncbi:MAG: hypothetical protein HOP29_09670 [Phycisphaerales bacterium]|nr:hypothetical protein [Phycisphaerales bacterium]
MNGKPKIIVEQGMGAAAIDALRAVGDVVILNRSDEPSLLAAATDADAVVVRSYGTVTARVIAAATRLRVIGRAGVGLDRVNLDAARARGIPVVYTPAASTESVAELTVGLMLALERTIPRGDAMIRDGRFMEARASHGLRALHGARELRGLTLGIVGLGRIGSAVARICGPGLGMNVIYNDIRPTNELPWFGEFGEADSCFLSPVACNLEVGRVPPADSNANRPSRPILTAVDKPTLYATADLVSLHVPLTDQTRGLINSAALRKFKPTATLINTSRGPVINGVDLAGALRDGVLAGAALDVFDPEPPPPGDPLLSAPNLLMSPHAGARTEAALSRMDDVVHDVIAILQNHPPTHVA